MCPTCPSDSLNTVNALRRTKETKQQESEDIIICEKVMHVECLTTQTWDKEKGQVSPADPQGSVHTKKRPEAVGPCRRQRGPQALVPGTPCIIAWSAPPGDCCNTSGRGSGHGPGTVE